MDGRKIDGRRVVVDVERARTVKEWRPRRLGGGIGGTRIGSPSRNIKVFNHCTPRVAVSAAQISGRTNAEPSHPEEEDRDRDRGAWGHVSMRR